MDDLDKKRDELAKRQSEFYQDKGMGAGIQIGWDACRKEMEKKYILIEYHYNALTNITSVCDKQLKEMKKKIADYQEALETIALEKLPITYGELDAGGGPITYLEPSPAANIASEVLGEYEKGK